MSIIPAFPPLLKGLATGPANPFSVAVSEAEKGIDSGLLTWSLSTERLRAAIVLAPEMPLEQAMAAFCACGVGIQNALGAHAPPETAVHLDWTGGIRMNGGHVGGLHAAASTRDPSVEPNWLVVGLELTLTLPDTLEPGETPDWTALNQEGCAEIDPTLILEAWSRHSMLWLHGLDDAKGRANLHREWKSLAWKIGQEISLPMDGTHHSGTFLGIDENFGMLLKLGSKTHLIPLYKLLEDL
jgi:BirA family biotin operon repressor/biotin-[acetyl-CoA-carboxylase] ligase